VPAEPPPSPGERRAGALTSHILPASATMVGVCVTVLSIVKLASPGTLGYIIDKFLALGSLVFLASAMLSFVSIRSQAARLEAVAEWVFLAGLGLLSAVTVVIAFAIA
jgi:hypothetical protein